jgi:hypothetical protein
VYCVRCNYDLHGLPSRHCPECGQLFDPTDDRTFLRVPKRPKSYATVLAAYLVPLTASALLWLTASLPFPYPLSMRLRAVGMLMCGPLIILGHDAAPAVGPMLWLGWFVLLYQTRARSRPSGSTPPSRCCS